MCTCAAVIDEYSSVEVEGEKFMTERCLQVHRDVLVLIDQKYIRDPLESDGIRLYTILRTKDEVVAA